MNFELHLLTSILDSRTPEVCLKKVLDSGDIFIQHPEKWVALTDYYTKYGKVPSKQAFTAKYQMELPTPEDPLEFYIDHAKEQALFNTLMKAHEELGNLLKNGKNKGAASFIQEKALQLTNSFKVGKDVDYVTTLEERIADYKYKFENPGVTGIPSGWPILDNYTTGWQASEFIALLGKSKSYKSWILLTWALHAWLSGRKVLIYSREMPAKQMYKRVDAMLTKVNYSCLRYGFKTQEDFDEFCTKLRNNVTGYVRERLTVLDATGSGDLPEVEYLHNKVALMKPDIVFVDGIYLIQGKGNADWEKFKYVTNKIKQIAVSLEIPIIGTTQATKKAKASNIDKSDTAYGPSLEQDCDYLFSINRIINGLTEELDPNLVIRAVASRDGEDFACKVIPDFEQMEFRAEAYIEEESEIPESDFDQPF